MPYNPTWNNPYVTTNPYGQAQYQPTVQPTMMYQQPVNGIVKVNGRDSALQYQLPPNSTSPALFDNGGKVFYVVSTDGTGTKTIETFDFSPHEDVQPVTVNGVQFVSRKEFDDFVAKVNAVIGEIGNGPNAAIRYTADAATTEHVDAKADSER